MCAGRLGRFVVIAALVAAVVALVRTLRGNPAPQFSNHPTVNGGPSATPDAAPEVAAPSAPDPEPEPEPEPDTDTDTEPSWVAPVDGACPPGYPIKAKLKSAIYHQPGGLAYERTNPDRCYPNPEAAEADGLRAAKR